MKLYNIREWSKAPLPRELQNLYRNYWQLRYDALRLGCRDPYICNIITAQIHRYLQTHHIPTQIHDGNNLNISCPHMWNVVKLPQGTYIVDGSYYQTHYARTVTGIIPGPLGKYLTTHGITNLYQLLGVIDTKLMGKHHAFKMIGDKTPDQALYTQIADTLDDRTLKHIQGRLLPILLRITPQDDPEYEGSQYDPDTADLHPAYDDIDDNPETIQDEF